MNKYKGFLEMNDGAKTGTLPFGTIEEVKKRLSAILTLTTRYFKRKGVDYGANGKLFTYEEEHDGIKAVLIYKVTTELCADVTNDFVRK